MIKTDEFCPEQKEAIGKIVGETMKIKNAIKNIGTALLIGAASVAPVKAGTSVEFLTGDKSAFVDVQTTNDLTKRLSFFSQGKFRATYDNNVSAFSMLDIYGKIGAGFSGALETQASSGSNIIPRAGITYFKQIGNFSAFLESSLKLDKKTDFEEFAVFSYNKSINDKLKLTAVSKNWANAGSNGLNCYICMLRLGLTSNGYTIGPVCDIAVGPDYKPSFNTGVSVKKSF